MPRKKNPSDNFENRKLAIDFIEKASKSIYNTTTKYQLENYLGINDLNTVVEKLNEIITLMNIPGPSLPSYRKGTFYR